MSLLVPPRHIGPELLDQPGNAPAEVERALREIQWVNRRLAGWAVLRRHLPGIVESLPDRPVSILDLGAGSADLPRAMVSCGRSVGRMLRVTAVDHATDVVRFARRDCAGEPAVRIVQADLFHLPFAPGSFDVVTCSLFLHHFDPEEAVRLLRIMADQARHAVLINDLERHRIAYWGIRLLARLWSMGRLFRNDAPLSVLRAYRPAELRELLRSAGLPGIEVRRHFPFRMAAVGPVPGGPGGTAR